MICILYYFILTVSVFFNCTLSLLYTVNEACISVLTRLNKVYNNNNNNNNSRVVDPIRLWVSFIFFLQNWLAMDRKWTINDLHKERMREGKVPRMGFLHSHQFEVYSNIDQNNASKSCFCSFSHWVNINIWNIKHMKPFTFSFPPIRAVINDSLAPWSGNFSRFFSEFCSA